MFVFLCFRSCIQLYNAGTNYVAHFVHVSYKDYPTMFDKAAAEVSGGLEVCQLRSAIVWSSLGLKQISSYSGIFEYNFRDLNIHFKVNIMT